jgi:hypothetical protein
MTPRQASPRVPTDSLKAADALMPAGMRSRSRRNWPGSLSGPSAISLRRTGEEAKGQPADKAAGAQHRQVDGRKKVSEMAAVSHERFPIIHISTESSTGSPWTLLLAICANGSQYLEGPDSTLFSISMQDCGMPRMPQSGLYSNMRVRCLPRPRCWVRYSIYTSARQPSQSLRLSNSGFSLWAYVIRPRACKIRPPRPLTLRAWPRTTAERCRRERYTAGTDLVALDTSIQ